MNAFHWRLPVVQDEPKPISPQLAYYRRKYALGILPRQLRQRGEPVIDQRFKANRK